MYFYNHLRNYSKTIIASGTWILVTLSRGIFTIVIYLDFHSAKRALWLVDYWSRAPDQIQMYPDRDTIDLFSFAITWTSLGKHNIQDGDWWWAFFFSLDKIVAKSRKSVFDHNSKPFKRMRKKINWRKRLQILHGKLHSRCFRERGRRSRRNLWSERPLLP